MGKLHRLCAFAWMMVTNVGCTVVLPEWITITRGTGDGDDSADPPNLPAPETPRGEMSELTPEQQVKKDEADAYIRDVIYQGRPIEKTVQGYSGVIYDYMKIAPLGIDLPDLSGLLPAPPADGIQLGLTELEKYPELLGPVGTTVFTRPDFSKYIMTDTGATSVEDWVQNHQVPSIPDSAYRLYAGLNIVEPNRGVSARVNMFKPEVAQGSFSVIELVVACPAIGPATEFLGILLSVDRANAEADALTSGATPVRMHVEHWKYDNGQRTGSYDAYGGDFVPYEERLNATGAVMDQVSVAGGDQWEHALMLIQAPNGDWVVLYNFQYLGAYPAHNLKSLQHGACRTQVYGEVYNPHPEQGWVATEMGSGQFSGAAQGHVAWIRQIRYFDQNFFPVEPTVDDAAHWTAPYHPPCYDRQSLYFQGSAGPLMTLGGPGGKNPLCAAKIP